MKRTTADFILAAKKVHGKKYAYSQVEYTNNATPVKITCSKHGTFMQRPADHLLGRGCKKCGSKKSANNRKLGIDQFIVRAKKVHGSKYDYSKVQYINNSTPVCIICREHGEFWQQPQSHLNGYGCPKETGTKLSAAITKTTADFVDAATKIHGKKYDYSKVKYESVLTKVYIICPQHGEFLQKPNTHLNGHGCPKCSPVAKSDTETFIKKARIKHGDVYDYSQVEYNLATDKVKIGCRKHGIFSQLAYAHLNGQGCPKCAKSRRKSVVEKRLTTWLEKLGEKPITQNRKILDGKEIDIFLPAHNLGIEVNGLYWHSEVFKEPKEHQNKSILASSKGIKLLHLWEHQLEQKMPIIKSMLRVRMQRARLRIFARECSIARIQQAEAKSFLEKCHLQGYAASELQYGLFLDEDLVAVMTLGKPRFNKDAEWEIIRLATKLNTIVIGGASRLFTAFLREVSPASVVSYADLDYADGGVYKNLGFSISKYTAPAYFWVSGHNALPRYRTQKHKLQKLLGATFDPNLTERENMERAGFYRVFNSGNAVFTWKNPNAEKANYRGICRTRKSGTW